MQNATTSQHDGGSIIPSSNDGAEGSKQDSNSAIDLRQAAHDFQDRNGQHHPIAEFLYQLTKMLTDDNSEIVEWSDGRIRVHHPERLEAEVLHKYFRHSKFASFQRQLNYFGFRKIAGKGKMSPCSYVNDAATSDIRSLLLIKRKTNGSAARKAAMQHRAAGLAGGGMNPALAGMNLQALTRGQPLSMLNGQAITSAMAILQENALRAGLGQVPLQQANPQAQLNLMALQQHQQQLQEFQNQQLQAAQQQAQGQNQDQQLSNLGFGNAAQAPGQQQLQPRPAHSQDPNNQMMQPANIEQLRAQLAALSGQNAVNANSLNASAIHLATMQAPAAALKQLSNPNSMDNPASAALNSATAALNAQNSSMPATAAMATAAMDASKGANLDLFSSAANLKSLLNEHTGQFEANAPNGGRQGVNPNMNSVASQVLLNRLPSSNTIFPEHSSLSFGNMLGSSNRLSSLLSLNSFVGSREASLADLAAATNAVQFSGAQNHLQMADVYKNRSSNP